MVLTHYGIKGMKWGIRRSEAQLARVRKEKPPRGPHEDYKKAHSRKSVKKMSDKELQERLKRLDMEERYERMNPSAVNRGKKAVNKAIKSGATVAAVTTTGLTIYNNIGRIKKILS